jgi:hypothetical protein
MGQFPDSLTNDTFRFTFTIRAFGRRLNPKRLAISMYFPQGSIKYTSIICHKDLRMAVGTVRIFIEPSDKH